MYPICGDPSKIQTTYYCAYDRMCSLTEGAMARYRRRTDYSGDVCENVAIACPC